MKAILTATLAVLTLTQSAFAGIKLGDSILAGDVMMKSTDGAMVSINKTAGPKGTLVVFTCNHCPFVIAWQSRMVLLAQRCQKENIGVIFINANDPIAYDTDNFAGMQAFAKENRYTFPYVVDAGSAVAQQFGATRTPEAFLFDAENKLIYNGAIDDSRTPAQVQAFWLADAMTALLAGEKPAIQETKSIGCGIKFY